MSRPSFLHRYVGVIRQGGPSHAFVREEPVCGSGGDALYLTTDPIVTCARCLRSLARAPLSVNPLEQKT